MAIYTITEQTKIAQATEEKIKALTENELSKEEILKTLKQPMQFTDKDGNVTKQVPGYTDEQIAKLMKEFNEKGNLDNSENNPNASLPDATDATNTAPKPDVNAKNENAGTPDKKEEAPNPPTDKKDEGTADQAEKTSE